MADYIKKTVLGTFTVFIFLVIAALFSYLFRILLGRTISLEDFGMFFALLSVGSFLNIIKDLGLGQSLLYFIPRYNVKKDIGKIKSLIKNVLLIEICVSILLVLLLIIGAGFLAKNYFHYHNSQIIIIFAFAFLFSSIEVIFQTFFQAFQNGFLYSIHHSLRSIILFVITGISLLFLYPDIINAKSDIYIPIFAYLISCILLTIIFSIVFFKKIFPQFFSTASEKIDVQKVVTFGIVSIILVFGFNLLSSIDTLMLTYFRSLEEVGLYSAASSLTSLVLYIPIATVIVVVPLASQLWAQKATKTISSAISILITYSLIILIPAGSVLFVYPDLIIRLFFGEKFSLASTALMILSFGVIFYGVAVIIMNILLAIKGPKKSAYIYILGIILNVILNFILIPELGITGAAISTCCSYLFIFILSIFAINNTINIKSGFLKYFTTIISGVIFVLVVSFLKKIITLPVIAELIVVLGLGILFYIILLFLLKVIKIYELMEIKRQIFNNRKNS